MTDAIEPSAGWLDGREHVLPVRVYYEDTDFTGVVYHGAYVRYFERGRSEMLRVMGLDHARLLALDTPTAFTVVRLAIDFKRSARIDDALTVRTIYERVKGPRLFVAQRIMRGDELITEAQVEVACIDLAGRARRPPASLLAAVQPLFT
jgi:acyl-CoA thioester hydrolase